MNTLTDRLNTAIWEAAKADPELERELLADMGHTPESWKETAKQINARVLQLLEERRKGSV